MKKFTRKELEQFDGRNGSPAYVTYRGKVYDVTESFLWQDGKHQVLHQAGRVLTREMENAPHGAEFLEKFPKVGILIVEGP